MVNTLMVEPTESEDKAELDRYCDALICKSSEDGGKGFSLGSNLTDVFVQLPHQF